MKNRIYYILTLITPLMLSSCLKDDEVMGPSTPGYVSNLVEFYDVTKPVSSAAAPSVLYVPKTLEVIPDDEFTIMLSYSGADVAPQDIVLELEPDASAIEAYNDAEGTELHLLNPSWYELPSSVTIKKGEKRVAVTVKIKPEEFDQSVSNALAVRIKSASYGTISGNFGTAIYSLPIKSIWQGTYDYYVNNNYGTIDGNVGEYSDTGIELTTVGPNRLRVEGVAQTYGGWTEYQFNADNTSIIEVVAFSGSLLATKIDKVVEVDAENGIFEIHWTWAGRGTVERWKRTGD